MTALQETLYLMSIPGMRESIIEGMNTPIEECVEEIDWWVRDCRGLFVADKYKTQACILSNWRIIDC